MVRLSEHRILAYLLVMVLVITQFSVLTVRTHAEEISIESILEESETLPTEEDPDLQDAEPGDSDLEDPGLDPDPDIDPDSDLESNPDLDTDTDAEPDTKPDLSASQDEVDATGGTDAPAPSGQLTKAAATQSLGSSSAKLEFKPLQGSLTEAELAEVTVEIYEGYLRSGGNNLLPENIRSSSYLTLVNTNAQDEYYLGEGVYSYFVHGEGYYSVIKVFLVTEEDLAEENAVKELVIETGKFGGNGFEPNPNNKAGYNNIPNGAVISGQDLVTALFPDEILEHYSTENMGSGLIPYDGFTTPFFTNSDRKLHEFTSQDDMMEFIRDIEGGNMRLFNLGRSPVYEYEMPLILFTTSNIPANASMERAAEIITSNGKPTVWHQAQIHPNEPASGEAALVMIEEMQGAFGDELLEEINVIIIPRINIDGSYIFSRATAKGFDMNRDHMALKAIELVYLHDAYVKFMPELVIDGHEFTFYGLNAEGYMSNSDDLQTDPATSLNNDPEVNALAIRAVQPVFENAKDAGIRVNHYGTTTNNPIGRAYYGLYGSVSVLVETRGIGAGSQNFERRVYSQVVTAKSLYLFAAENSEELKNTVAEARKTVAVNGKTYNEDDIVVLQQSASGEEKWPDTIEVVTYGFSGEPRNTSRDLSLQDTVLRSRPRPTAYVIPMGEQWTDKALYILENQGVEVYALEPGTVLPLQQYYFEGYTGRRVNSVDDYNAGLLPETEVSFPNGAIIVPMDQVSGNIIAMLMEPDVNDSIGYDGTLVQSGIVPQAANENDTYPIYRYIQDDPRTTLNLGGTTQPAKYSLTVVNGTGSGTYTSGQTVTITANPAPAGQVFDRWIGGATFANPEAQTTTITMPASNATVTATYREEGKEPPLVYTLTLAANTGGRITQGSSGSYPAGANVTVVAAPYDGYVFTGWTVMGNLNLSNPNSAAVTFAMPEANVTLTANFRATSSSSGGGSSSSGGSNISDQQRASNANAALGALANRSANVDVNGTVNSTAIADEVKSAAASSPDGTVTVKVRNAASISPAAMRAITNAAPNRKITLHADTLNADGKGVQGRLYIDPDALAGRTTDLKLGVYTEETQTSSITNLYQKHFANKVSVVKLDETGLLGARIQVAVKLDLSDMDIDALALYNHDPATNQYTRIAEASYYVDANGYLHFYTEQGGYIIISQDTLVKK